MTSGIVVVDKPPAWTSHDVVGRLRRLAGTRKVGHAGTLDPMATGVLIIGVNKATRLLGHLMLGEKEYLATIRLGQTTITDDREGELTASVNAAGLTLDQIADAVSNFVGDISQVPSSVSAIKVDGKRSYARVRAGEDVKLKARPVHVSTFEVGAVRTEGDVVDVDVRVECSSGTYIRALARDLGRTLGVGGHLIQLRRTRVGDFTIDQASTLDALGENFSMIGLDAAARQTFAAIDVSAAQAIDIGYGRALEGLEIPANGPVALFSPRGEFMALYESGEHGAKPVAVFATSSPS